MTQIEIARLAYQNATEDQKAEILKLYPDLLNGEPFEFTEEHFRFIQDQEEFPFYIGKGLVSPDNRMKCLFIDRCNYDIEVSEDRGKKIIKFYKKPYPCQ